MIQQTLQAHGSDATIFKNKDQPSERQIIARTMRNQEKEGGRKKYFCFLEGTDISTGDVIQLKGSRDIWRITETEDHIHSGVVVQIKAFYEKYEATNLQSSTTHYGTELTVNREGVFFKGQYFDALYKIGEIFSQAKSSIVLIDGYIDDQVLHVLSGKASGTSIQILTFSKSCTPTFLTFANAFKKQHTKLEIRTSSAFHDRFILIDQTDLYHIGASIKDAGHKGFMFSRIEEAFIKTSFIKQWTSEWSTAKIEI
jgi:hypothetical protein